jgi:hypothetical protein
MNILIIRHSYPLLITLKKAASSEFSSRAHGAIIFELSALKVPALISTKYTVIYLGVEAASRNKSYKN